MICPRCITSRHLALTNTTHDAMKIDTKNESRKIIQMIQGGHAECFLWPGTELYLQNWLTGLVVCNCKGNYGQPDRKTSVFFYDFPYLLPGILDHPNRSTRSTPSTVVDKKTIRSTTTLKLILE